MSASIIKFGKISIILRALCQLSHLIDKLVNHVVMALMMSTACTVLHEQHMHACPLSMSTRSSQAAHLGRRAWFMQGWYRPTLSIISSALNRVPSECCFCFVPLSFSMDSLIYTARLGMKSVWPRWLCHMLWQGARCIQQRNVYRQKLLWCKAWHRNVCLLGITLDSGAGSEPWRWTIAW